MTVNKRLVSVRVDVELWKRVRVRSVSAGLTAAAVVEGALELWLSMDDGNDLKAPVSQRTIRPDVRPVVRETIRTDAPSLYKRASGPESGPAADSRCVCGQHWKDHQGGGSGKLAVATNCRNFREQGG